MDTPPPTQPLGRPPVYMLYATLTPNRQKGWLIGQKGNFGVNWTNEIRRMI